MLGLLAAFLGLLCFPTLCDSQCSDDCFPPIGGLEIGREVTVSSQCTTEFCIVGDTSTIACSDQHGPSSINDADLDSFWVSEVNNNETVTLQVDFENPVFFESTVLSWPFHPPVSLFLERSSDNGSTWHPYRYFAQNCSMAFGMLEQIDIPGMKFSPDVAICTKPNYSSFPTSEGMVAFSTDLHLEGTNSEEEIAYQVITNLRFHLVHHNLLAEKDCEKFFAVSHWNISGSCFCNGHTETCYPAPDEQIFPGKVYSGCMCEHNTGGTNCETCLTGFNSQPWQPGNDTNANECTACMCNKHAEDCYYNQTLMSAICIDCVDNTTGDDCSACLPSFYETSLIPTDPNFCQSCDCDPDGSIDSECDDLTGQCQCKANVHPSLPNLKCSECRDDFFNLSGANPLGCTACSCDEGTVETIPCDKTTGVCTCLSVNVLGDLCDLCPDGFFDLAGGCTSPCQCNSIGSIGISCDPISGQCMCRENIMGDLCDRPMAGNFYKTLDAILFEAEEADFITFKPLLLLPEDSDGLLYTGRGYAEITSTQGEISFSVQVPISSEYEVFVRYASEDGAVDAVFDVNIESIQPVLTSPSCFMLTNSSVISESLGKFPTLPSSSDYRSFGSLCLESGVDYIVDISFTTDIESQWLLDSLVLMPNFSTVSPYYTSLSMSERALANECFPYKLPTSHNPLCDALYFSFSVEFYEQVFPCDPVSAIGSSSTDTCDPFGGAYECDPGFIGTLCDQCANGFYNFSSSGCMSCSCNANGSLSDVCDAETGTCTCKDGVGDELCDSCLPGYYGLTSDGCSFCNCSEYALSSLCDDSGNCSCPPGIMTPLCDICQDGYYNISSSGCQLCDCSSFGSLSSLCDKDTGQCPCQENVVGTDCSSCMTGFIPTNSSLQDPCIPCICSGQSSQCEPDSESFILDAITSNFTSLCTLNVLECDDGWRIIYADPPTTFSFNDENGVKYLLLNGGVGGQPPQLLAPPKFLGDQRFSYGLTFEVRISIPGGNVFPDDSLYVWLMSSFLNVPLVGTFTSTVLSTDPPNVFLLLTIELVEDEWKVGSADGSNATFKQFYSALTDLTNLSFVADYTANVLEVNSVQAIQLFFRNRTAESGGQSDDLITFENCTCPPGTMGQFCEACSLGYYRTSGSPVDPCLPCECNSLDEVCEIDTGVCLNCTGNSTGDSCQLCKAGFYGNTTQSISCLPCACPTSDNPLSPTCFLDSDGNHTCDMCQTGYAGRFCQLCDNGFYREPETNECVSCDCTGNADPALGPACDPITGQCLNCLNNTAGFNCGVCDAGYYGDPLIDVPCQECECVINGTISGSNICDRITGQCFCRPAVAMPDCSVCVDGYYGNPSEGGDCQPCECPTLDNSHSPTCFLDVDGLPTCDACAPGHTGRNCEFCENGYFGDPTLPDGGCNDCMCNGNVDPNLGPTCNMTTGMCLNCQNHTTGFFCQQCVFGYYDALKDDDDIKCQECTCNTNGTHPDICDHLSGICFCLPDIAQPSCDRCKDGFYGDPLLKIQCRPCECPSTGSNSFSDTCFLDSDGLPTCDACAPGHGGRLCEFCVDGYFGDPTLPGGQCEECECNGNVDPDLGPTCNVTTGQCLNCQNHTTGFNCEKCQTGFYGDILAGDSCQACDCHPNGTYEGICNDTTGECLCIEGAIGTFCNQCEPGYWGLSSGLGCIECDCCANGTIDSSSVCDENSGICSCLDGIAGPDCCECSYGYFNYTSSGCQDCDCGELAEEQCDIVTGQCTCKLGGTGFKCDQCDFGFSGRAPNCTACHDCYFPWYTVLQGLQHNVTFYLNRIQGVLESYEGYSEDQIKALIADLYNTLNSTKSFVAGLSPNKTTIQNIEMKLNTVSETYSMLLYDVLAIQQSLNDSEVILNLVENFINMVDNTQYMGINYSDVYTVLAKLNTTIKGLYEDATSAYNQLTMDLATVTILANDITSFQMQALAYLHSIEYASNTSQDATEMVSTTYSLMPDLVSVDLIFSQVSSNLQWIENGTAIANSSYTKLESDFVKLNMSIEALGEILSNASVVVAALDADATNALLLASSNLAMVDELMNKAMQALSKAESLVSLISSASQDAKQGFTQLGQVESNASAILSHPNLPVSNADELAQNISMVSLSEQDIEKILNDTLVYENATRSLSEAMEALGIATTASDSLKSMQTFVTSLCSALNDSEANIQQAFATLKTVQALSTAVADNLTDATDGIGNITSVAEQAEVVTDDTYNIVSNALAVGEAQEAMAAASANKSTFILNAVGIESQNLASTEESLDDTETQVTDRVSATELAANTSKSARQDAKQLEADSKAVSIEELDDLLADYVSKLQEIKTVKTEIESLQQQAKELTDTLNAAAAKYKKCYKTP